LETIRQIAHRVFDIIRRRKILGLTQDEVAKKANLTQAQIARLENSSQIPRVDTLIKVAIALGMSIKLDEEAATRNQLAHA
jgi:transcriptional regulator with XRE-family HTH domain